MNSSSKGTSGVVDLGTVLTNLNDAINGLSEGNSNATRNDFIVAQYAGGGTSTKTYHRRSLAKIFAALNASDITTALGYTPYNATNPNGYTTNAGTVTSVKVGTTSYTPSSGVVSLPTYPTTLPASDVYAWAKASSKPSYTASEVSALPISGGTLTGTAKIEGIKGLEFNEAAGVSVDAYGNLKHKTPGSGNHWHIDKSDGTKVLSVYTDGTVKTLNGLKVDGSNSRVFGVLKGSNGDNVDIGWDWENKDGAGAYFRSSDYSGQQGDFGFFARKSDGTTVQLVGKPDGTLTWNGQGIVLNNDSRLTNSRPASDVYSWAKASSKPSYTLSEVGASMSVSAISANTSSSCSITGSSNSGKS